MLRAAGHEVRTFDLTAAHKDRAHEHIPGDLCELTEVRKAVQGVDAVVHLAALASDRAGTGPDIIRVNVLGTTNILFACYEAGVERVVAYSSVNALGAVGGHRPAAYLPIDDRYPRLPLSPYQLSKHLGEEACRSFSEKYGMVTVCLRPVFVMSLDHYKWVRDRKQPNYDREKWEYFAYVDVRDVCEAAIRGLTVEGVTHDAFLLTADDTTAIITTEELVERCYPDTPWRQDRGAYLADNPYRSLMDCSHAANVLGWQPRHSWRHAEGDWAPSARD
jgi:nucleoside-diphosphate-sugar epimerase